MQTDQPDDDLSTDINPATGLPMIDGAGIDIAGNPYGVDVHAWPPAPPPVPMYDAWLPPSFDPW